MGRCQLWVSWVAKLLPAAGTEAHQAHVPQDKDLPQVVVPV